MLEETHGTEVERRREVDWRAATVEQKQRTYRQHADPVETATSFSVRFSASKLLAAVVAINVLHEVTQVAVKTKLISRLSQGRLYIVERKYFPFAL